MKGIVLAALVAGAVFLAACGGDDSESSEQAGDCGSSPAPALTPSGSGPSAFTMALRINQLADILGVEDALEDRILDRDVFVVNTEYLETTPEKSEVLVETLSEKYPCNRIVALNGLGSDSSKEGYAFALAGHPDVDAILVDWEQITYEEAGKGSWEPSQQRNLPLISKELGLLAKQLSETKTRMGLVPQYLPPWDYGRTAQTIATANYELDPTHLGYQVVQTQTNCGTPGAPGPEIGPLAAELIKQYQPLFGQGGSGKGPELTPVLVQHLGFEIAFGPDPDPRASEALERIGAEQAANCSKEVLDAGGAGILYWATPDSIRDMLDTDVGKALRPSS